MVLFGAFYSGALRKIGKLEQHGLHPRLKKGRGGPLIPNPQTATNPFSRAANSLPGRLLDRVSDCLGDFWAGAACMSLINQGFMIRVWGLGLGIWRFGNGTPCGSGFLTSTARMPSGKDWSTAPVGPAPRTVRWIRVEGLEFRA